MRLFGQQFKIHTFTLKRYGLNDAFDQSVTLLLRKVGRCPLPFSSFARAGLEGGVWRRVDAGDEAPEFAVLVSLNLALSHPP